MTKDRLLQKLQIIKYNVLWPEESWEIDTGFTERPIWINHEGYGFFACDEPCSYYKAEGISDEKWAYIRNRIEEGSINWEDIQGTTLAQMSFFQDEEEFSLDKIQNLLSLPSKLGTYYYSGDDVMGIHFFNCEDDFLRYFEKSCFLQEQIP